MDYQNATLACYWLKQAVNNFNSYYRGEKLAVDSIFPGIDVSESDRFFVFFHTLPQEKKEEIIKQIEEYIDTNNLCDKLISFLKLDCDPITNLLYFLEKERILVFPLKYSLRRIAEYLITHYIGATYLPNWVTELPFLLNKLKEEHLFLSAKSNYQSISLCWETTFTVAKLVCALSRIKQLHSLQSSQCLEFKEWLSRLVQENGLMLELLLDQVIHANLHLCWFDIPMLKKLSKSVHRELRLLNKQFTEIFTYNYFTWAKGESNTNEKRPLMVSDFLQSVFLPEYNAHLEKYGIQPVYIFLFDGLRYDGFEFIEPHLLTALKEKYKVKKEYLLLSLLPSVTKISRYALFSGGYPLSQSLKEEKVLLEQFLSYMSDKYKFLSVACFSLKTDFLNYSSLSEVFNDPAILKVLFFQLCDEKLHQNRGSLTTFYLEVLTYFNELITPYLMHIPEKSLIFILSDHGFTKVRKKAQRIIIPGLVSFNSKGYHYRYIELSEELLEKLNLKRRRDLFCVPSCEVSDANMSVNRKITNWVVAKPGSYFEFEPQQKGARRPFYTHGGISLEEVIVPCVVLVPAG